ncbi:uncharacterized protein [Littorina saxatilis]|uniref:Uncharacterized protein n=1 Tax=Littorina saxatilis TaxID=31220 RepID=A0AAN9GLS2_9CAEN
MARGTVFLLLLLSFVALAFGQQETAPEPCLKTRAECSVGISSVSVINNNYFCCSAGFSMSWYNNNCSCRKTSDVVPCGSGPQACRNANSFSSDGNGNTRCCQGGYSMSSMSGFFNGQYVNTCSCSRPLNGFGGIGGGVFINNGGGYVDPNFNQTEFNQRMSDWQQRFSAQMRGMQANLQRNLGNMFQRLGLRG